MPKSKLLISLGSEVKRFCRSEKKGAVFLEMRKRID